MIEIKSEKKSWGINLPENEKEVTPEILATITEGIELPPYHCIVAMCFKIRLFDIAFNINNQRDQNVTVVPLLAKASEEMLKKHNVSIGKKIVVDRSTLERGVHLTLPVMASQSNVIRYIKEDEKLRQNLLSGTDGKSKQVNLEVITDSAEDKINRVASKSPEVIILEFKIIPIVDIVATIDVNHKINDPFKVAALVN